MNFNGKIKTKLSLSKIVSMTIITIVSFLAGYFHNDCKHITRK